MSLVFLHTADWQLGKPFASIPDDAKRHAVQRERFESIRRLRPFIEQSGASFVLVAGDVFDSSQAVQADVSAACAAIGSLQVPVYVIPGNHDHAGPGSIWGQKFFLREQQLLAPNLHVLLERRPVVLDQAILFPAPLLRRHDPVDPTAWARQVVMDTDLPTDRPRILLAHGTVVNFSATVEWDSEEADSTGMNWIDLEKQPEAEYDYMALGDWHGVRQVGAKAWYSGTPEMDRFQKGDQHEPGYILRVSVARGQAPQVERVPHSGLTWLTLSHHLANDEDLTALSADLDAQIGTQGDRHLLRLSLSGALSLQGADALEALLESWRARLLRLKLDDQVGVEPSADELAALTQRPDPLIATVATQLHQQLSGSSEEAALSRIALRELYTACRG